MSKVFVPCMGKTACQENEYRCITCGRSQAEISGTRELIDALVNFVQEMDYENSDRFFEYIASKAAKKLNHQRQDA